VDEWDTAAQGSRIRLASFRGRGFGCEQFFAV